MRQNKYFPQWLREALFPKQDSTIGLDGLRQNTSNAYYAWLTIAQRGMEAELPWTRDDQVVNPARDGHVYRQNRQTISLQRLAVPAGDAHGGTISVQGKQAKGIQ